MSSVVPGFEYDIFISYRHNDNRSGWVTEFVNSLQEELAATIKDPLSIYFDKNPHDGLLETHSVDKSLEGKLKCLIFIPIISQTYCDPKSFAWQQEFCAFNKLAKEDQFGRDIKLSNGNVASRILSIKIHDLDVDDKATIESAISGVLRAIEFIYKEPGVNRPLKLADSKVDNQNKTDYRNQINKVANAVKGIITAIKNPVSKSKADIQQPVKSKSSKKIYVLATVLLVIAAASFLYSRLSSIQEPVVGDKSIAVLPFMNMSNDPEQEYFSDGLSEEIINTLVQIKGLKVIARTSSFQFKGKNEDLRVIGTQLGVATVLEGSVRKSGSTVRITAQLIKTSDGTHLWSKVFDRNLSDVLKVQDEIAAEIAADFQLTINPEFGHRKSRSLNEEAYRLYQIGRSFYDRADPKDRNLAIRYFEQSVKIDSTFASAWSYLSICYFSIDYSKSLQYNHKAITLDNHEPDALANQIYYAGTDLQFKEAHQLLLKSVALKLEVPRLLRQQGQCFYRLGFYAQGIDYCKRALALDPLQAYSHSILGEALAADGHLAEAEAAYRRSFEVNKNPEALIYVLLLQRKLTEIDKLIALEDDPADKDFIYALKYSIEGDSKKSEEFIERVKANRNALTLANMYAFLGEKETAFEWLEKAVDERRAGLVYFKVSPFLISLRKDERYKSLSSKLNFPE
jgi:TolB-like protein/Tfp pilus assembly protein PilF